MIIRATSGLSLLCAVLTSATMLTVVEAAFAQSKVGVTSAADGDPLGKPPAENERILRIGIDVQANEVVSTHANDRAHLVFLDGTSLTVGPNARLTIDKFVYDPNSKTGDLAITATQGVFRLVGGKISKNNPITINTPSSTIGIRGGITMFSVNQRSTSAAFIFGHHLFMSSLGVTQNVTRQGSVVTANLGFAPSPPTLLPPGGVAGLISQLETGSNSSGSGGNAADQKARSSGFSDNNSGQPQNLQNTIAGGLPPNTNNNAITNAVNNSNPAANPNPNSPPTTATTTATTETTPQGSQTPPGGSAPGGTSPKTTQTLRGYVGGLLVASASGKENGGSVTTGLAGGRAGDLTIKTDADTSTAKAKIIVRGLDGSITSPNAVLKLGSGRHGDSFFQNNANFITGTVNGRTTVRVGDATIRARDTSVLLTANQVPGGSYAGVGCSACDFLTFGEWATTVTTRGNSDSPTAVVTQAPWVAGTLATQLPNTQSASFSGGMWGQAQNGSSAIRNVTGSFGLNYSWGTGSGAWTANFDNRSYVGTVTSSGRVSFSGNNIPATTGSNNMSVNGAFYTGPGAAGSVVGVGGQFSAVGPGNSYQASGVFGGSKR
jgi:hypothetical protein